MSNANYTNEYRHKIYEFIGLMLKDILKLEGFLK